MTHDVIIECNGVGPVIKHVQVDMPYYQNGIVTYAVAPLDTLKPKELARYKRRLDRLKDEMLEIIADMTGGTIYNSDGTPKYD